MMTVNLGQGQLRSPKHLNWENFFINLWEEQAWRKWANGQNNDSEKKNIYDSPGVLYM